MAELNVPVPYATIQLAIDASAPGDEVVIAAGVYMEHLDNSGHPDITIRSESGVASDVTVMWAAPPPQAVIYAPMGIVIQNITIWYRNADPTGGCISCGGGGIGALCVEDCVLVSAGNGIWQADEISIQRCHCTYAGIGGAGGGEGISGLQGTVTTCFVSDYPDCGILCTGGTISDCTVVNTGGFYGIYADMAWNNLVYNVRTWGLLAVSASHHNIVWDSGVLDYVFGAGSDDHGTADVTADGRSIFKPAPDYHLAGASLAQYSGTPSATNDLDGVPYQNPPSRGCYEYVGSTSGTLTKVRARLMAAGLSRTKI